MRRIADYQDYLTTSHAITDDEAKKQGTNAVHIYRLQRALRILLGDAMHNVAEHSVAKELKDLFSEDATTFDTTAFNIVSAAMLQQVTGAKVVFIAEGDAPSPDLKVGELAYVECKDLHPASRDGLAQGLQDQLSKAVDQLNTATDADPLVGIGICVDVPWGTLPLHDDEWQAIRSVLEMPSGPTFVCITCSGVNITNEAVGYPAAITVATKSQVPDRLRDELISRLASRWFRLAEEGFEVGSLGA